WRVQALEKAVHTRGCISISKGSDPLSALSGLCWGEGIVLVKTISDSADQGGRNNVHSNHLLSGYDVTGCLNIPEPSGSNAYQGAICWGDGIFLIKVGPGPEGIKNNWNIVHRERGEFVQSCTATGVEHSV